MLLLVEEDTDIEKWPTGSSTMETSKRHREFPRGFRSERIFSDLSKCRLCGAWVAEAGVDRLQ